MTRRLHRALCLLIILLALALRWRYVRDISLFVDEFVTAWAARSILERGLPILPAGTLYPHGLLYTYLQVPFAAGPFQEQMIRIPALLCSLVGVPVLYRIGARSFSPLVGLLAACALALDPDCIVWGGRARMYGLLQLLTMLVLYFFYRGLSHGRHRDHLLAMGLLVAAIWVHAEAMLLLPVLGLTALVCLPPRRLLRPGYLLPFCLAALGAAAFFLAMTLGQPEHAGAVRTARPYLALASNAADNLRAYAPALVGAHRLPMTLLAGAGLLAAVFRRRNDLLPGRHGRTAPPGPAWGHTPLTYLFTVLMLFLVLFLLLAGPTWRNERYLFLLLPALFLAAAEVLARGLARFFSAPGLAPWRAAVVLVPAALYLGLVGSPRAYRQEPGYDLAFRYLQQRVEAGEPGKILTLAPAAAMLYMERCDGYTIQRDYREYIVPCPDGGPACDLWTGSPLVNSIEGLDVLLGTSRAWLVVDDWRFGTRYEPAFVAHVMATMELEYHEREVMIWRGGGPGAEEMAAHADPLPAPRR